MYSLSRSLIGRNEARMLIQLRVVVRTTSRTDRPSTPTLYWIPKTGIQSWTSWYWKLGSVGLKPISRSSDRPNEMKAKTRAVILIAPGWLRGTRATTSAPIRGMNVIRLIKGTLAMLTCRPR